MKPFKNHFFILGFLTVLGSTNAQIIYTDLNPDCESTMDTSIGYADNLCPIDFDNNATVEYSFRWDTFDTSWYMHMPYGTNCEIALEGTATINNARFVKPLQFNEAINSTLTWGVSSPEPFIGVQEFFTSNYNFLNLGDRYVGVKFKIGTNTHFGWVLINFQTVGTTRKIIVKSYAYNTSPNTQILAGQTNGLSAIENESRPVTIYPNPFSDTIFIDGLDPNGYKLSITNSMGQIVVEDNLKSNVIDLKVLAKGVYYVNIKSPAVVILSTKLIKS